jgi:hypothetical protein
MTNVYRLAHHKRRKHIFCFTRPELNLLLSIYSRRVIAGDWKAYAIDYEGGVAQFSIFSHARAQPLYTVIKNRRPSDRTLKYSVLKGSSKISQSDSLSAALAVFERNLKLVSP